MNATSFGSEGAALIVARWPVGGIRTHLASNYPAITAAGYRCRFVVPDDAALPGLRAGLGLDADAIVGVPRSGKDYPLWRVVRSLLGAESYDLVHAHGLTAAAHASLACLGTGVPLIVTLHEPLRQARFRGLIGPGKRWILGRALARAQALVTVSQDARDNLLRFFPNLRRLAHRVHTIPNGVNTARFTVSSQDADLRDQLELDSETVLIGYLGRFMPEKGFPLLLDAVERLHRHGGVRPFHVAGFGSGDMRREYARAIVTRGLDRLVTLHDAVPDVAPILPQLDLVVVPSLWEASSLISMEAMCAGTPVLGADCPGLREVLRDTPSRTFTTGDVTSLECALREALASPWTDSAREFTDTARSRFDNRRSAQRLVALYDSIARPAAVAIAG